MEKLELSFGEIRVLGEDLAEVIIRARTEVTAKMIDEYDRTLRMHFKCPCRVLVNKKNAYHLTFDAQQKVADMQSIRAAAILSQTRAGHVSSRIIMMFPGKGKWKMSFFSDRETALHWLETH